MKKGDKVFHKLFGQGIVQFSEDNSAIVRFGPGLEECPLDELTLVKGIEESIEKATTANFEKVIVKTQEFMVNSINNEWGLFSQSHIDLLPHQLWICKQVLAKWPVNYLVADDVGLGKTIEAGLMIWGLKNSRNIQRILILAPASLVGQWQVRLKKMFDLNFNVYTSSQDGDKINFWDMNTSVIASFNTMSLDRNGRQERFIGSEYQWDLVIVDEAHHMNAETKTGKTNQYKLFEEMINNDKITSKILFTGTPHRGKDYGFWSLMKLVEPEVFDPTKDNDEQYKMLSEYFIRNNKQNCVDINGKKMFKELHQHPYKFKYTEKEALFYEEMSDFIETGKAYAQSLEDGRIYQQITLVLIALQKLASSSIAAVCSALETRRNNVLKQKAAHEKTKIEAFGEDDEENNKKFLDTIKDDSFKLMDNEAENINHLLKLASEIEIESKIKRITEIIETDYADDSVLIFTEYKQTQKLIMSELMKKYGNNTVSFINGDEKLYGVIFPDGSVKDISKSRIQAAEDFNEGNVRFLISTEAAGEGIDLQKNCHVLIHADLPWNPMRLHQRVGRINRYGQTHDVEVVSIRNEDNIEALIWDKLEQKILRIEEAFGAAMKDPEDMMQLVLGMTTDSFYSDLFFNANGKSKEDLSSWFDEKTKTFGGQDVISTVDKIFSNVKSFKVSGLKDVPKCDLPDLVPYLRRALKLQGRKLEKDEDNLYSFIKPDSWKGYGIKPRYDNLCFDRDSKIGNMTGLGNKLFVKLSESMHDIKDCVTVIEGTKSYFVYRVFEKQTASNARVTESSIVLSFDSTTQKTEIVKSDDFLHSVNEVLKVSKSGNHIHSIPSDADVLLKDQLSKYQFVLPGSELIYALVGE